MQVSVIPVAVCHCPAGQSVQVVLEALMNFPAAQAVQAEAVVCAAVALILPAAQSEHVAPSVPYLPLEHPMQSLL